MASPTHPQPGELLHRGHVLAHLQPGELLQHDHRHTELKNVLTVGQIAAASSRLKVHTPLQPGELLQQSHSAERRATV